MDFLSFTTVERIIFLANEYYKVDEGSKIISSTDLHSEVERCLLDENRASLVSLLSSLSKNEMAEVEALVCLGQGLGGELAEDWDNLFKAALNNSDSVNYVVKKKKLAKFLEAGLEKIASN